MRLRLLSIFVVAIVTPLVCFGDEIVPIAADSEGLEQFERNVAKGAVDSHYHPQNFGATVSAEAKKLKTEAPASKSFGQWVVSQRSHGGDPTGSTNPSLANGPQGSPASSSTNLPNGHGNGNDNANGHGNGHGH